MGFEPKPPQEKKIHFSFWITKETAAPLGTFWESSCVFSGHFFFG